MKKTLILVIFTIFLASFALSITIDGKFWDWQEIKIFDQCKPRILSKDRSGLDMQSVKLVLTKKYLYALIEGDSVTGQTQDKGEGFRRTSVRLSFSSAQSPLNRARILAHPGDPWRIKVSVPQAGSIKVGSKKDKYWCFGKYGKNYFIEMKMPVFTDAKGIHVGSIRGPLLQLSPGNTSSRNHISDLLINTVDTRTHRLVDTTSIPIKKGAL